MKRAATTLVASIAALTLSTPPASASTVRFGFEEVCFPQPGFDVCLREEGQANFADAGSGNVSFYIHDFIASRLVIGDQELASNSQTYKVHSLLKNGESAQFRQTIITASKENGISCAITEVRVIVAGEVRHQDVSVKCN